MWARSTHLCDLRVPSAEMASWPRATFNVWTAASVALDATHPPPVSPTFSSPSHSEISGNAAPGLPATRYATHSSG